MRRCGGTWQPAIGKGGASNVHGLLQKLRRAAPILRKLLDALDKGGRGSGRGGGHQRPRRRGR